MRTDSSSEGEAPGPVDRLDAFGIYQLARRHFDDFWNDSEALGKDYRGRELARRRVRSLDSICANIEEGFARGYGRELPQHLKIARGEARESRGRYERCRFLLPAGLIDTRAGTLNHINGGLTKTIRTIERRCNTADNPGPSPSPTTGHSSPHDP